AVARTRGERVLAERDVLTGDVLLVGAATVVETHHTRVGGGPLRPVEEAVLERELLSRVISGRQPGDEWRDQPTVRIDRDDPRAFVRPVAGVRGLIGIRAEQPAAAEPLLEGDVDGGPGRLEAAAARRGLAEWARDLVAVLVEDEDIRRHRVVGRRHP